MPRTERDRSIDILRMIALTGIILVHAQPIDFLKQLRSFDVPLMVFLSAVCVKQSATPLKGYLGYVKKRFIRLVLPSWIFMTGYFAISYVLFSNALNWPFIAQCYTLTTGWYFWIIRILFVLAVISPILVWLSSKSSKKSLLLYSVGTIVVTEVLFKLNASQWSVVILTGIPYVAIYLYGLNISQMSPKQLKLLSFISFLLFLVIAVVLYVYKGHFVLTGAYKYPPRIYYVSYGVGCIGLLWMVRKYIEVFFEKVRLASFCSYIGSHSFWIYLWHIPIVDTLVGKYPSYIVFPVTFLTAVLISFVQSSLVSLLGARLSPEKAKIFYSVFSG